MKTIELTDEAYAELLELKNHISMKTREISNQDILVLPNINNAKRIVDWEPEYTFNQCIIDIIKSIWHEQETGIVDSIT